MWWLGVSGGYSWRGGSVSACDGVWCWGGGDELLAEGCGSGVGTAGCGAGEQQHGCLKGD